MQSCMRRVRFSYGHRLHNYSGKCSTLHGHNAVAEIHATPAENLDAQGMIIDFSILKRTVGEWIEKHWDHTTILSEDDTETITLLRQVRGEKSPFILPGNPTAENLARYLLLTVCPSLLRDSGVVVHKIVLWETENCFAEETLDPSSEKAKELYHLVV